MSDPWNIIFLSTKTIMEFNSRETRLYITNSVTLLSNHSHIVNNFDLFYTSNKIIRFILYQRNLGILLRQIWCLSLSGGGGHTTSFQALWNTFFIFEQFNFYFIFFGGGITTIINKYFLAIAENFKKKILHIV